MRSSEMAIALPLLMLASLLIVSPAFCAQSTASAGCGSSPALAAGASQSFELESGDLKREFLVHLPTGYQVDEATSLVLDFHGYTGTASGEEAYTRWSTFADEQGFIVVYPQGTGFTADSGQLVTSWNDEAGSASPGPEGPICSEEASFYPTPPECGEKPRCNWASCHDDVGFISELLDHLEDSYCIDLDRVYATGMSNGGMFVHRLGCALPERFAAIAPVGGTLARGFQCAPPGSTPVSLMNIWGRGDHYVSQEKAMSSDGYFYTSAKDVLAKWASKAAQDCQEEAIAYATSADGELGMSCIQHDGCKSGAEIVHCSWDGEHAWPQSDKLDTGNQIIWEFFEQNPRVRAATSD